MEIPEKTDNILSFGDWQKQLDHTQQQIAAFSTATEKMKEMHQTILAAEVPDPTVEQQLSAIISQIKWQNSVILGNFKKFEDYLKEHTGTAEEKQSAAKTKGQYQSLIATYLKAAKHYKIEKEKFRDNCKEKLKQYLKNPETNFTSEEVEAMIEEGNFSYYMKNYTAATEHHKTFVEGAETRRRRILQLQQSIDQVYGVMAEYEAVLDKKD